MANRRNSWLQLLMALAMLLVLSGIPTEGQAPSSGPAPSNGPKNHQPGPSNTGTAQHKGNGATNGNVHGGTKTNGQNAAPGVGAPVGPQGQDDEGDAGNFDDGQWGNVPQFFFPGNGQPPQGSPGGRPQQGQNAWFQGPLPPYMFGPGLFGDDGGDDEWEEGDDEEDGMFPFGGGGGGGYGPPGNGPGDFEEEEGDEGWENPMANPVQGKPGSVGNKQTSGPATGVKGKNGVIGNNVQQQQQHALNQGGTLEGPGAGFGGPDDSGDDDQDQPPTAAKPQVLGSTHGATGAAPPQPSPANKAAGDQKGAATGHTSVTAEKCPLPNEFPPNKDAYCKTKANGKYPIGTCKEYIECHSGQHATSHQCPNAQMFDVKQQRCVAHVSNCNGWNPAKSHQPTALPTAKDYCQDRPKGKYPLPCCSSYFECAGHGGPASGNKLTACPANNVFQASTGHCVDMAHAQGHEKCQSDLMAIGDHSGSTTSTTSSNTKTSSNTQGHH